ncbi:MAG TPA: HD domain-containing protein [Thermodesulfobacteriota bacterium]|nr:HD domain-containing protein [Thermodesulfobacteriota bacterium]
MRLDDLQREILADPILSKLSNLAKEKKISFYLVGGYLRDLLLGRHRKDYDFILPREASSFLSVIEKTFHFHFFRVGKEETSTFRIIRDEMSMDITPFQGRTIEEDLHRRDFTINTLAYSLGDGIWHWIEGTLEDIQNRRIRTVSDRSIDHDPLRMLRAIRYLCTLEDFTIGEKLKEEISLKKQMILKIPSERIKMELDRILLSSRPNIGMKILYETGLLYVFFPEFRGLEALGQDEHHHLDALNHTLLAIEKISWAMEWMMLKKRPPVLSQEDLLCVCYAVLFHDIGKQDTYSKDERGRVHFYHHEKYSCLTAKRIMERLRFSTLTRETVLHLIQNHMRILNLSRETKETALKRLVHQIGDQTPLLVIHSLADKEASRGILSSQNDEVVEGHCLHLLDLHRENEIIHPPALITGYDVMALGYSAGPKVGHILDLVRQKQVVGEIKTREEALKVLREKFSLE